MGIVDAILGANKGANVNQMSQQFGLSNDQTTSALKHLIPALGGGVRRNTQNEAGMSALLGALQKGNHSQYIDNAALLGQASSVTDGNKILGHLLGSKEVSRQVAARTSQKTGIDTGILKKMLPLAATMFMGGLGKQQSSGGLGSLVAGLAGGGMPAPEPKKAQGLLGKLLDADGDGSMVDDLFGMAKKFM